MQTYISENIPIRTVQTLIDEAKALGMHVVHRPEQAKSNVVKLWDELEVRRMQMCVSPEAAEKAPCVKTGLSTALPHGKPQ